MAPVPKPQARRTKHYFREWREKAGLTQDQAMGRLGWSQSKISRIENGKNPYNEDDLAAAARAYDCSPTDLIEVNPLKDGQVVDLMRLLRNADPKVRDEILEFATFKLGRTG